MLLMLHLRYRFSACNRYRALACDLPSTVLVFLFRYAGFDAVAN